MLTRVRAGNFLRTIEEEWPQPQNGDYGLWQAGCRAGHPKRHNAATRKCLKHTKTKEFCNHALKPVHATLRNTLMFFCEVDGSRGRGKDSSAAGEQNSGADG